VFYLDTPSNARANGLKVSTSKEAAIEARQVSYTDQASWKLMSARFKSIEKQILAYGGMVTTNLEEPKLTHIVLDNDDLSRRISLMRRTEL
jgi:DNA ligase-4